LMPTYPMYQATGVRLRGYRSGWSP
jgi:hypothetical protein